MCVACCGSSVNDCDRDEDGNFALYVSCLALYSILDDAFEVRLSAGSCLVMILWPFY
jgi:hypothetical protein